MPVDKVFKGLRFERVRSKPISGGYERLYFGRVPAHPSRFRVVGVSVHHYGSRRIEDVETVGKRRKHISYV